VTLPPLSELPPPAGSDRATLLSSPPGHRPPPPPQFPPPQYHAAPMCARVTSLSPAPQRGKPVPLSPLHRSPPCHSLCFSSFRCTLLDSLCCANQCCRANSHGRCPSFFRAPRAALCLKPRCATVSSQRTIALSHRVPSRRPSISGRFRCRPLLHELNISAMLLTDYSGSSPNTVLVLPPSGSLFHGRLTDDPAIPAESTLAQSSASTRVTPCSFPTNPPTASISGPHLHCHSSLPEPRRCEKPDSRVSPHRPPPTSNGSLTTPSCPSHRSPLAIAVGWPKPAGPPPRRVYG
jgi:hypothetical protein